MRTDHKENIVWVSPGHSEDLVIPKRDFKALKSRVRVHKRKLLGIRIMIALIATFILVGFYFISSKSNPGRNTERPVNAANVGPPVKSTSSSDWEFERILAISIEPKEVVQPKINSFESSPESPEPIPTSLLMAPKDEEIDQSEQETQRKPTLPTDTEAESVKDSVVVTQPYVPSKFERAYPKVGYDSLNQYLTQYINQGLLGAHEDWDTIQISFFIQEDGTPSAIALSEDFPDSIFNSIQSIILDMPVWEPAKADGIPVKTRYRLPLKIDSLSGPPEP